MAKLFDCLFGRTRFTQFVQYLIAFCSKLEAAGDVISSAVVELVGVDFIVKFGDSGSSGSRDIRTAHFVMDDDNDERRGTQVVT